MAKKPPVRYGKSLADIMGYKAAYKQYRDNGYKGTHPITRPVIKPFIWDILYSTDAYSLNSMNVYGESDVYCKGKRQLNGREIDKLGLRKTESQLPNLVRKKKKKNRG